MGLKSYGAIDESEADRGKYRNEARIPEFGVRARCANYVGRPGEYALSCGCGSRLAFVQGKAGRLYLPGGCVRPGERPEGAFEPSGENQTEGSRQTGRNRRSTDDPVGSICLILSTSSARSPGACASEGSRRAPRARAYEISGPISFSAKLTIPMISLPALWLTVW